MDARDGFGVYTYADTGSKYEGSWSNGKRHGDGKFAHKTHAYEGNFVDDQALGGGKFNFDNGAVQKGNFVVDGAGVGEADEEDTTTRPTMKWVGTEISMQQDKA
jgi:radial spoke head protein 1